MAAESFGITMDAGLGGIQQLIARNGNIQSRPVTVAAAGLVYKRGCVVMGATVDAVFVKAVNGALPAATDIVGIIATEVDATGSDKKTAMYVAGEFVEKAVVDGSSATLVAGDILALKETLLNQGINIVTSAYGDIAQAL